MKNFSVREKSNFAYFSPFTFLFGDPLPMH